MTRHVFRNHPPILCDCDEQLHDIVRVGDTVYFTCIACLATVRVIHAPIPQLSWWERAAAGWHRAKRDLLEMAIVFIVVGIITTAMVLGALVLMYGDVAHATTVER